MLFWVTEDATDGDDTADVVGLLCGVEDLAEA